MEPLKDIKIYDYPNNGSKPNLIHKNKIFKKLDNNILKDVYKNGKTQ